MNDNVIRFPEIDRIMKRCPKCHSEIWHFEEGSVCSNMKCDWDDDPGPVVEFIEIVQFITQVKGPDSEWSTIDQPSRTLMGAREIYNIRWEVTRRINMDDPGHEIRLIRRTVRQYDEVVDTDE